MSQTKAQLINGKSATVEFTAGSASTPAVTFTGDPNTGIYSPGADQLAISTAGTGRLFVDASGKVGIGTSAPGYALDVVGVINANATVRASNGTHVGLFGSEVFAAGVVGVGSISNHPFVLGTNSAERLRITSDGKVGIGTSSPSALLSANATVASYVATAFNIGEPSLANGRQLYAGYNTTDGTGFIQAVHWGTEFKPLILNPNGGNVGIGTSSPQNQLSIGSAASGQLGLTLDWTGTGGPYAVAGLTADRATGEIRHYGHTAFYHIFYTNATEKVRITSDGKVGIGTQAPQAVLHTRSGGYNAVFSTGEIPASSTAISLGSYADTAPGSSGVSIRAYHNHGATVASDLAFEVNGNQEKARIDSSGRLLVGTSSYDGNARAVIQGNTSSNTTGALVVRYNGTRPLSADEGIGSIRFESTSQTNANYHYASISCDTDGASSSDTDIPGRLVFSTTADGANSPTERMRIGNSGQVLIGTATNYGNATRLEVNFTGALQEYGLGLNAESLTSGSTQWVEFTSGAGTQRGSISWSGTAVQYNTSSDYRLKENIALITDGISRLQQLKPSRFNYIEYPGLIVDGFIAHEVQAVVPEAINGEKDAVDDDGNPIYQGIDQSKLVPLLTAALQEAVTRIETLETTNADLLARVITLENA